MAKRYIGDAVITITYLDRGDYAGSICVPGRASGKRRYCWNFSDLRAAPVGFGRGVAYDSPRAYDVMAASAASFGAHEDGTIANEVEGWQREDGTYEIRRSPRGPVVDARLIRNPMASMWGRYGGYGS